MHFASPTPTHPFTLPQPTTTPFNRSPAPPYTTNRPPTHSPCLLLCQRRLLPRLFLFHLSPLSQTKKKNERNRTTPNTRCDRIPVPHNMPPRTAPRHLLPMYVHTRASWWHQRRRRQNDTNEWGRGRGGGGEAVQRTRKREGINQTVTLHIYHYPLVAHLAVFQTLTESFPFRTPILPNLS